MHPIGRLLLFAYISTTSAINCSWNGHLEIRQFRNLAELQSNNISFLATDAAFNGHRVRFNYLGLNTLKVNSFKAYTSEYISFLDLQNNSITNIENGTFQTLACLDYLDLSHNNITNLTKDIFKDLSNLKQLNLSDNHIGFINNFVFDYLGSLTHLDVAFNKISLIESRAFQKVVNLEYLNLSDNELKRIDKFTFDQLIHLKRIYINRIDLAMLYMGCFHNNKKLEVIEAIDNQMVVFQPSVKQQFPQLKLLNISENFLGEDQMKELITQFNNTNTMLDVSGNSFACEKLNSSLLNFKHFNVTIANIDKLSVECESLPKSYHTIIVFAIVTLIIIVAMFLFICFIDRWRFCRFRFSTAQSLLDYDYLESSRNS